MLLLALALRRFPLLLIVRASLLLEALPAVAVVLLLVDSMVVALLLFAAPVAVAVVLLLVDVMVVALLLFAAPMVVVMADILLKGIW